MGVLLKMAACGRPRPRQLLLRVSWGAHPGTSAQSDRHPTNPTASTSTPIHSYPCPYFLGLESALHRDRLSRKNSKVFAICREGLQLQVLPLMLRKTWNTLEMEVFMGNRAGEGGGKAEILFLRNTQLYRHWAGFPLLPQLGSGARPSPRPLHGQDTWECLPKASLLGSRAGALGSVTDRVLG